LAIDLVAYLQGTLRWILFFPTPMSVRDTNGDHASNGSFQDEVSRFAKDQNLVHHLDLFRKAAHLIGEDDSQGESGPRLETAEVDAIRKETEQKWGQPRMLYFTILVCSLGAMEQGTAQTSMNGANLYFPKELGIGSDSARDRFLVGLINGGIYLSIALMSVAFVFR
jgi:hypothetical protein